MSDNDKTLAEQYAIEQANHYKKKADHNKEESIWCFRGVMVCSLLVPLFVSLGEGVWLSKIIPSFLSALAAFSTAWLQLRKPQALWTVYRTAQRKIETTLVHYQFRVEKFDFTPDSTDQANKLLISEVTSFASEAHNIWTQNVPDVSALSLDKIKTK
ncbi:DUF4231 domain-containing protein [Photobacterium phosphoreum]|uniref:DUF4231 domain-containing protein n=1 Tax=Photobacterium phosphoreum TaxID=659 RepID=UPI000D17E768|nr:DUF4231 domain-containing protein [Photobacterium phosphoreum]PSW33991.1 DUF4231 domain-containing protein [Photobacterium phosphoreum]